MYHKKIILGLSLGAILLSGCGAGPKITIPSYAPPREEAKIKQMITQDDKLPEGAYLAIAINPEILHLNRGIKKLQSFLIDSIKTKLTQTNYIALNPIAGEKDVVLIMDISNYKYKTEARKRSVELEVNFTLSKGAEEFLSKSYTSIKNRQSNDAAKLPSEAQLASEASKAVVEDFVSDISPLKTFQLREFKSLPDDIAYAIDYAKRRNYNGAIKAMERYKGEKDMNFYYDLAILYEAQASTTENLSGLDKADEYYNIALSKGGAKDELVTAAKARFDNFYELLQKTKSQDKKNQALINEKNKDLGSTTDEFE